MCVVLWFHCPLPFPGAHWRVVCVPEHPHHRVLPGDHLQHRLLPAPVGSGIGPSAYVSLHASISICVCVSVWCVSVWGVSYVCVCGGCMYVCVMRVYVSPPAELAEVLWGMVLNRAITQAAGGSGIGFVAVFALWAFWAGTVLP